MAKTKTTKKKGSSVKAAKKVKPKSAKKPAKAKSAKKSRGGSSAFMKPMKISADLAPIAGKGPMPRSEVVKKLWAYIKKNKLQDQKNKRNINADENLRKVFGGKKVVSMFEMTKLVSKHLS